MKARLPRSNNPGVVHAFEENGVGLLSVCGGIEAMPYAVEQTDDPLSCAGCGAVWEAPPTCGLRLPANPDPTVHHDCAVHVGAPDQGRLF